jgi:hypothetical protein
MNEIRVLEESFPNATVLLCRFHVMDYFSKRIRREYGLKGEDGDNMLKHVQMMIDASDASDYEAVRDDMIEMINENKRFLKYFYKNWDKCREKWVLYYRKSLPHLNNHTNNRLESGWSKLKPNLSRYTVFDEAIQEILTVQLLHQRHFLSNIGKIGKVRHFNYDEEMTQVLNCATKYATNLVENEYNFAMKV